MVVAVILNHDIMKTNKSLDSNDMKNMCSTKTDPL